MSRYFHTITIEIPASQVKDSKGNWITPDPPTKEIYNGRCEINSAARELIDGNGKTIQYNAIIYLPVLPERVKIGSKIKVTDGDGDIFTGVVKQFSKGLKNCRIWV